MGVKQIRARRAEIPNHAGKGARIAEALDRDHVDRDSELPDLVRNGVPVSLLQHGHARLGTATIEMLQIGKEHPLRAAHAERVDQVDDTDRRRVLHLQGCPALPCEDPQ